MKNGIKSHRWAMTCSVGIAASLTLLCPITAFAQHTVPSAGSGNASSTAAEWDTKWNLFQWRGKSATDVNNKVNQEYARFVGKSWQGYSGGSDSERFVFDYPGNANMAYCKWSDTGTYGSVLIEAQCYGLMIAVQMNDKDAFDKLWRFTKTYMQLGNRNDTSGARSFFSWKIPLKSDGTADSANRINGPAPDGEQWITASLYMASGRWGNSTGINYQQEANDIAECMLHLNEYNNNPYDGWSNMFTYDDGTTGSNQVLFDPYDDINFTDPAYHLPAFYDLFAKCGPTNDRSQWAKIAQKSRTYLLPRNAGFDVSGTHPNNSGDNDNGISHLPSGYAEFDGTAHYHSGEPTNGTTWGPEAWRVGLNLATDYMWWGSSSNSDFNYHKQIVAGIQNTLASKAGGWRTASQSFPYEEYRKLNGVALYSNPESSGGVHSAGPTACNAAASLVSDSNYADEFVDELWSKGQPTGNGRGYGQYLYMTALLECSGKFRVYMPGGSQSTDPTFSIDSSGTGVTVAGGAALNLAAYVHCTGGTFSNGKIGLRMYGPNGEVTGGPTIEGVNLSSGQTQGVTWNLAAPTVAGSYDVYAGVWKSDWSNAYPFTSLGKITVNSDTSLYDFENNGTATTQSWSSRWGGISNVTTSTTQKKNGSYSLAFTVTSGSGTGYQAVGVSNPSVSAGKTVKAWVWVPSELQLSAMEVQVRNTSNQIVSTGYVAASSLTRNAWNLVTAQVNSSPGAINLLVVQFNTSGTGSGTAYVDCVTRN